MRGDPDRDWTARKLDLQVDESNLDAHRDRHIAAEEHIVQAVAALALVPPPADNVGAILYAQAHAALAAAMEANVQSGLLLESVGRAIEHERAHLEHEDGERLRAEAASEALNSELESLFAGLAARGIRAHKVPMPGGGYTIAFSRPEDEPPEA